MQKQESKMLRFHGYFRKNNIYIDNIVYLKHDT